MEKLDTDESWPLSKLVAVVPAGAAFMSILYVLGYSQSAAIPIMSLMTMQDYIVAALPWLLPAAIVLGVAHMAGAITARREIAGGISTPPTGAPRTKRILYSNTMVIAVLTSNLIALDIFARHVSATTVGAALYVIYIGLLEFSSPTSIVGDWMTAFGPRYMRLMFLAPVAIGIALCTGIDQGHRGGRLFDSSGVSVLELADTQKPIIGIVSFHVGDFLLVHVNTPSGRRPVLIALSEVRRISKQQTSGATAADTQ